MNEIEEKEENIFREGFLFPIFYLNLRESLFERFGPTPIWDIRFESKGNVCLEVFMGLTVCQTETSNFLYILLIKFLRKYKGLLVTQLVRL